MVLQNVTISGWLAVSLHSGVSSVPSNFCAAILLGDVAGILSSGRFRAAIAPENTCATATVIVSIACDLSTGFSACRAMVRPHFPLGGSALWPVAVVAKLPAHHRGSGPARMSDAGQRRCPLARRRFSTAHAALEGFPRCRPGHRHSARDCAEVLPLRRLSLAFFCARLSRKNSSTCSAALPAASRPSRASPRAWPKALPPHIRGFWRTRDAVRARSP